jgi:sugar phosphate isomerase/epimerase
MKSAVTISLVPEARGGPFVFWDDLDAACRQAKELAFDAVEIFAPAADAISVLKFEIPVAAVGTGGGWVKQQLSLTDRSEAIRRLAREFVVQIIDAAGAIGAPAIIGSMQGRCGPGADLEPTRAVLRDALNVLGKYAERHGVPLIYEPLNRYETNLVNTLGKGVELIESLSTKNVRLLADLFHMSIEERDLPQAILAAGKHIGHVHLADSNRRPAGFGHTDFAPIAKALREIGYDGYVSAECLPYPDSVSAARATIDTFNLHFRP